jgi:hypothetical protein
MSRAGLKSESHAGGRITTVEACSARLTNMLMRVLQMSIGCCRLSGREGRVSGLGTQYGLKW